jgi:hypothetical protein
MTILILAAFAAVALALGSANDRLARAPAPRFVRQ